MTASPRTKAERREMISDLRSAVEEIGDELSGALDELKELRERIEALREAKAWRVEAIRYLKAEK